MWLSPLHPVLAHALRVRERLSPKAASVGLWVQPGGLQSLGLPVWHASCFLPNEEEELRLHAGLPALGASGHALESRVASQRVYSSGLMLGTEIILGVLCMKEPLLHPSCPPPPSPPLSFPMGSLTPKQQWLGFGHVRTPSPG